MSDIPEEVKAIAKQWAGTDARITEGAGSSEGTWIFRCRDLEDGFVYQVYPPNTELRLREDNGRPYTGEPQNYWTVVCVNDAPDSWWVVDRDGTYQPWSGAAFVLDGWPS